MSIKIKNSTSVSISLHFEVKSEQVLQATLRNVMSELNSYIMQTVKSISKRGILREYMIEVRNLYDRFISEMDYSTILDVNLDSVQFDIDIIHVADLGLDMYCKFGMLAVQKAEKNVDYPLLFSKMKRCPSIKIYDDKLITKFNCIVMN